MENAQIIDVLNVALLEVQSHTETISQKVECVESLGLSFGDGWNVFAARKVEEAGEASAGVLDDNSFWRCRFGWRVEKQGPRSIRLQWIAITGCIN